MALYQRKKDGFILLFQQGKTLSGAPITVFPRIGDEFVCIGKGDEEGITMTNNGRSPVLMFNDMTESTLTIHTESSLRLPAALTSKALTARNKK